MRASDGRHNDTLDVTVTVTDTNERPELSGPSSIRYTENGAGAVATYQVADPEDDQIRWTLRGTDSDDFAISDSGDLTFVVPPDHEAPTDYQNSTDGVYADNVYQVSRQRRRRQLRGLHSRGRDRYRLGRTGARVTMFPHPQQNTSLDVTATDPDGAIEGVTWKWERSSNRSSWSTISGATSTSYTPGTDDLDRYLRATVTYTDKHGPTKKTVSATSATKTQAEPAANTAPSMPSTATRAVEENAADTDVGAPVVATTDAQGDPLAYSLGGADASLFTIDELTGQLKTKVALDHESPDHENLTVEVTATDPSKASGTTTVTVSVTDVNEPPEISGHYRIFFRENGTDAVYDYDDGDPDGGDTITWTVSRNRRRRLQHQQFRRVEVRLRPRLRGALGLGQEQRIQGDHPSRRPNRPRRHPLVRLQECHSQGHPGLRTPHRHRTRGG